MIYSFLFKYFRVYTFFKATDLYNECRSVAERWLFKFSEFNFVMVFSFLVFYLWKNEND